MQFSTDTWRWHQRISLERSYIEPSHLPLLQILVYARTTQSISKAWYHHDPANRHAGYNVWGDPSTSLSPWRSPSARENWVHLRCEAYIVRCGLCLCDIVLGVIGSCVIYIHGQYLNGTRGTKPKNTAPPRRCEHAHMYMCVFVCQRERERERGNWKSHPCRTAALTGVVWWM